MFCSLHGDSRGAVHVIHQASEPSISSPIIKDFCHGQYIPSIMLTCLVSEPSGQEKTVFTCHHASLHPGSHLPALPFHRTIPISPSASALLQRQLERLPCLCLLSPETKGMHHQTIYIFFFSLFFFKAKSQVAQVSLKLFSGG